MDVRKPLSKKMRFEVFKRDLFTCQYCNAKPPKVPLEIDHLIPVSKKGTNHIDNLITACFDCNRGKSNNLLETVPHSILIKSEMKRIAVEQYKQYQKLLQKEKLQMEYDIDLVEQTFQIYKPNSCFGDTFRISVKKFIKELGVEEVIDSMESAMSKRSYGDGLKYFCGICWNKIKGE